MTSKNNRKLRQEKSSTKKYRYTLKKLSVGVASVAVGAGLIFGSADAQQVNAQDANVENEQVEAQQATQSIANLVGDTVSLNEAGRLEIPGLPEGLDLSAELPNGTVLQKRVPYHGNWEPLQTLDSQTVYAGDVLELFVTENGEIVDTHTVTVTGEGETRPEEETQVQYGRQAFTAVPTERSTSIGYFTEPHFTVTIEFPNGEQLTDQADYLGKASFNFQDANYTSTSGDTINVVSVVDREGNEIDLSSEELFNDPSINQSSTTVLGEVEETPSEYAVNIDANGGTINDEFTSSTVTDGEQYTLPYGFQSDIARPGYTLTGYAVEGELLDENGEAVTEISPYQANYTPQSDVTLTAIWEETNGNFQINLHDDEPASQTDRYSATLTAEDGTVYDLSSSSYNSESRAWEIENIPNGTYTLAVDGYDITEADKNGHPNTESNFIVNEDGTATVELTFEDDSSSSFIRYNVQGQQAELAYEDIVVPYETRTSNNRFMNEGEISINAVGQDGLIRRYENGTEEVLVPVQHQQILIGTGDPAQATDFDPQAVESLDIPVGADINDYAEAAIANASDLPEGTSFEWRTNSVTDGNTGEVTELISLPNVSELGQSQGVVRVTYADGSSDDVLVNINVVEAVQAPDAPEMNLITPLDNYVSGNAEVGNTVVVLDADGNEIGRTVVNRTPSWQVNLPEGETHNIGDVYYAYQIDAETGAESERAEVTVQDDAALTDLTIDPVYPGAEYITGTVNPEAESVQVIIDGATRSASVDEDGNWSVRTYNNADDLVAGATFSVRPRINGTTFRYEDNGIVLEAVEATINSVEEGASEITGTATPGARLRIRVAGSTNSTSLQTIGEDGQFSFSPWNYSATAGDVITVEWLEDDSVLASYTVEAAPVELPRPTTIRNERVQDGTVVNAADFVTNKEDFPEGTTFLFWDYDTDSGSESILLEVDPNPVFNNQRVVIRAVHPNAEEPSDSFGFTIIVEAIEVAFDTEYRANSDLDYGERVVVQEGQNGYVDAEGNVTQAAVNEIIEVGNVRSRYQNIPFYTEYAADPSLDYGEEAVIEDGHRGEYYEMTEFEVDPETGELVNPGEAYIDEETVVEAQNRIIGVGNQRRRYQNIPFYREYVADPNLTFGEEVVIEEGHRGEYYELTDFEVDPETGELVNPGEAYVDEESVVDAQNRVIAIGNVESTTEDIPFIVESFETDLLAVGETLVLREGANGELITTTTYSIDPETGQLTNPVETVEENDAVSRIVLVGTRVDLPEIELHDDDISGRKGSTVSPEDLISNLDDFADGTEFVFVDPETGETFDSYRFTGNGRQADELIIRAIDPETDATTDSEIIEFETERKRGPFGQIIGHINNTFRFVNRVLESARRTIINTISFLKWF